MLAVKPLPRSRALAILSAASMVFVAILLLSSCTSGQSSSGSAGPASGDSQENAAQTEAPPKQEIDTSGFIGTWHLVDLVQGDVRVSEANPDAVPLMYESDYFNLYEDGFFDLVQGDGVTHGSWEATSPSEGVFIIGARKDPFSISDGVLVFVTGDTTGYYALGEPYEAPSSPGNAGESAEAGDPNSAAAGSASAQGRVDSSAFVGTWNLADMVQEGQRASEVNPDGFAAYAESRYLNLDEDGFFEFVQDGEVFQGVWMASAPTEGLAMFGVDEIPMAVVDGALELGTEESGTIMYFAKGEHRDPPELPEGQTDLREAIGH